MRLKKEIKKNTPTLAIRTEIYILNIKPFFNFRLRFSHRLMAARNAKDHANFRPGSEENGPLMQTMGAGAITAVLTTSSIVDVASPDEQMNCENMQLISHEFEDRQGPDQK